MQSTIFPCTMKGGGAEKRVCLLWWRLGRGVSGWMVEEGVWDVHLHPPLQTGGKQTVDSTRYHVLFPQPAAGGGDRERGEKAGGERGEEGGGGGKNDEKTILILSSNDSC